MAYNYCKPLFGDYSVYVIILLLSHFSTTLIVFQSFMLMISTFGQLDHLAVALWFIMVLLHIDTNFNTSSLKHS